MKTLITKHNSKIFLCIFCRRHFTEDQKFETPSKKDNCEDPEIITPKTGIKIQFRNIVKQTKAAYCIIAHFELCKEEFNKKK